MKALLLAAAALLLGSAAQAETLRFPSAKPVATITFPDEWVSRETAEGVQSATREGDVQVFVDLAPAAASETVAKAAVQFLADNGVSFDQESLQSQDDTFNGMAGATISFTGTDASGPVDVVINIVGLSEETLLVFTYWGNKGADATYRSELDAITASVKPLTAG